MGQHVDIAQNSKLLIETQENLGHRLKISSIGSIKASHSIPLQILPHFDVKHIFVAQKLAKRHNFKNSILNLAIENLSKSCKKMQQLLKFKLSQWLDSSKNYTFTYPCNIMHKICMSTWPLILAQCALFIALNMMTMEKIGSWDEWCLIHKPSS